MPAAKFTSIYSGQQIESAIKKALALNTFEFEYISDVLINGVVFHTYWINTPTEDNQVKGFSMHPTTGKLYEIYSNCRQYSATSYLTEENAIELSEIDALFN